MKYSVVLNASICGCNIIINCFLFYASGKFTSSIFFLTSAKSPFLAVNLMDWLARLATSTVQHSTVFTDLVPVRVQSPN